MNNIEDKITARFTDVGNEIDPPRRLDEVINNETMLRFGSNEHKRSSLTPILTAAAVVAITVAGLVVATRDRQEPDSPAVAEQPEPSSVLPSAADDQNPTTGQIPATTIGLSSECGNARLVASTTSGGRTVEYWTVDGADFHADLLFENGVSQGGGCDPMSRADAYPQLPWTNYTLSVDPRDGTGLGHFTFLGQAPAGTVTVDIVTTIGTVNVEVTSPDGYFVVLADLPVESSPPPSPPPDVDVLERVDAYAADGTLLGTGGLGG